ncbi:hypothetical protein KORDIASMS9_03678 [Kordia sp. SMS9]|uniref:hypothetical protein n=1 Tax=Kordia sp. SMS9 TaxID=2282170 RepID=UPI000E10710E|nr:hypothetical protein [Kordia sp. SMS9]AXG71421.1 hypothetical protein KORDIASMS9_03678 [Kordia sp. SMS9]
MDFFTIMIILITLVVFVFIVLIAFVMKKSKDVKNDAFLETARKEMLQRILKKRKKLVPHKADFYLQITDAMTFERTAAVTNSKISGFLYNTHQKPIVAFERVDRGLNAKGQLVAVTKKHEFVYEFLGETITVFFDNSLLGSWNQSGKIFNADQKGIGQLKFSEDSKTLVLNDRTVATILKAPLYDTISNTNDVSYIFEELTLGTSLLSLHEKPTVKEEKWLTALAIFEITFYGNTPVA